MKMIAYGASKILELYLDQKESNIFSYCVDNFYPASSFNGLEINKPDVLEKEKIDEVMVVIFAVSNSALQQISSQLIKLGFRYKKNYIFYSDFLLDDFINKSEKLLGFKLNRKFYDYSLSSTLLAKKSIHTTILGTWLFLELLNKVDQMDGAIAEVGIFEGGNSILALNSMFNLKKKIFYLFDSFEGFSNLTEFDPDKFKKGDYNISTSFEEIEDLFRIFDEVKLVKGFVPESFKYIPEGEKFSLVFYDCDLFQPALDTFSFFWEKIVPGGYLLIHDYHAEKGGFEGVKKATDQFFKEKNIKIISFFENTMALIKKE